MSQEYKNKEALALEKPKQDLLNKNLFKFIFALSCSIFWVSPHPPMIDIPQHAGQVALLLDLLSNHSHWQDKFYINYFTPYWLGYGLWALLALAMPITIALKILLTINFCGFVFAGKYLRHCLQADERLDWLLIPSFFGFCFTWGFLTFIMAAPIGIIFIASILKARSKASLRSGINIFLSGIFLFFCHGLVFMMCMIIGGLSALSKSHSIKELSFRLAPYLALTPIVALYYLSAKSNATSANFTYDFDYLWLFNSDRLLQFIVLPWGTTESSSIFRQFGVIGLFSPFLIGSSFNKNKQAWLPFTSIILIWLTIPHFAMKTFFLYERFSIFILPFYILLFANPKYNKSPAARTSPSVQNISPWILPILVTASICITTKNTLDFAHESSDFDRIIKNIPERKVASAIIYDRASLAMANPAIYTHYASWYQAEKKGIVDFSFAWFGPQPIRFKQSALPTIKPGSEWLPNKLNWEKHLNEKYDYIFFRGNYLSAQIPLGNNPCLVKHIASSGNWHVYQRVSCKSHPDRSKL